MTRSTAIMMLAIATTALAACSAGAPEPTAARSSQPLLDITAPTTAEYCQSHTGNGTGETLFKCETFGGNGRTCATCHTDATGTFSPQDAQALYRKDPNAPLFRAIDSDEGLGVTYTRLLNDAVIRAGVDLPPNVTVLEMPNARTVFFNRGVPTTFDTPALDPVLMSDGRAPDLQAQALGAIHGHAQSSVEPTSVQLDKIASYESTLFSSPALRDFAQNGTVPTLPPGNTDAERRGRVLFVDGPQGKCALCHSGPFLNTTNEFNPRFGAGKRFESVSVSELNKANNPVLTFLFTNSDGTVTPVVSPDPGRALVTGNPADGTPALFKIPTLWGVSRTAPYFHDNSAKTLEDLGAHYQQFFAISAALFQRPDLLMSDQERDDMIAYLRLL